MANVDFSPDTPVEQQQYLNLASAKPDLQHFDIDVLSRLQENGGDGFTDDVEELASVSGDKIGSQTFDLAEVIDKSNDATPGSDVHDNVDLSTVGQQQDELVHTPVDHINHMHNGVDTVDGEQKYQLANSDKNKATPEQLNEEIQKLVVCLHDAGVPENEIRAALADGGTDEADFKKLQELAERKKIEEAMTFASDVAGLFGFGAKDPEQDKLKTQQLENRNPVLSFLGLNA